MKNNNKKKNKNLKIQFKCNFKNKIYLKNTKKKNQKMSLKRRTAKRDQPEIEEIKKGFEMFDIDNTGKISPFELKETMDAMNMKDKNPVIYSLISSLCTDEYKEGITSDDFIAYITEKMSEDTSEEGIRRIFDIFTEPNSETISLSNFVQAAKELREDVTEKELKDLLEKAKASGNELTFEEFYNIMINGIDVENMKNERVDTHSSKYSNKNENSIKNESSVRSRRSRKDDDEDNSKKEEKEETNSKRSYRSNRRSDNGEKIVTEEVTETKYSYRNRREKKEEEKSEEQPTSETGSRRRRRLGQ
jgi:Ca2+-binding EF-hand superfamily protein